MTIGVAAAEVEEVDAGKDDEEAGEEREGVYGVGGVEALEKDEGRAESSGCEGDVVEGVNSEKVSVVSFWSCEKEWKGCGEMKEALTWRQRID